MSRKWIILAALMLSGCAAPYQGPKIIRRDPVPHDWTKGDWGQLK